MVYKSIFFRHVLLFVFAFNFSNNSFTQISIINEGTSNPTLIYKGKPLFKIGPLPETAVFSVRWESSGFPHAEWLDWMERHKLGYGRVYPEGGPVIGGHSDTEVTIDDKGRLFPFKVAYWKEGRPMVDITQFNPEYWENFARVINECAKRGIILQMQLYQRVYFHPPREEEYPDRWQVNYFNPENNINNFPVPEGRGGYGLWPAMTDDNSVWKGIHTRWVELVLKGIGDNGNVIIDLMNEGSFLRGGLTREWVEYTLDIIEKWEKENNTSILVGFDFDHLFKHNDPNLEYGLAHPRMGVIISEGSEGHVVPELVAGTRRPQERSLAIEFREKYRKPVISTNSPSYTITEDLWKSNLYQWYSMMVKVQGVGIYAKEFPLDFSDPLVVNYAFRSKVLMDFFDRLRDYGGMDLASDIIAKAPGKYRLALASANEMVIYLHTGSESDKTRAGKKLVLKGLAMPGVNDVEINIFHPSSGESLSFKGSVKNNGLSFKLPGFHNDIAIHIIEIP